MKAKVLIIGGGGREHALAWKIAQSPQVSEVFVAPGNGGTANIATNLDIHWTDVKSLLEFAVKHQIDLTVVGQEAASAAGVVDAFLAAGLAIFGPTQAAVQIEASKAYSKDLMTRQGVPTAQYRNFRDAAAAKAYLKNQNFPIVLKASGLAEGKGVIIAADMAEAEAAIIDIMIKKTYGESGSTMVIEDFLAGEEVSVHALCDGQSAVLFPSSQDHKQVFDASLGPNTGGMGVVAPLPWVTPVMTDFIRQQIVQPTLDGLAADNAPFTGCLYPGLMIESGGIKVLEFNARFGDPEAETYLRLLVSDLYTLLLSCTAKNLDPSQVVWSDGAAISVAVASAGYPGKYQKGLPITGIELAEKLPGVVVFQAGTIQKNGQLLTNGGRVLYVTAHGKSIKLARKKAYEALKLIHFSGMHYRTDIGLAAEKAEQC